MHKADHYTGYLASNGCVITTWPGGHLASVTAEWTVRNNFAGKITRLRAVDDTGAHWYGTSPGRGMYAKIHRAKMGR